MKKQILLAVVSVFCAMSTLSASTVLIGDLASYTGLSGADDSQLAAYKGGTTSVGKAVGFTMSTTEFTLDSVTLRLSVAATAVPLVELWSGTATSITGTGPLLTLTNPGSMSTSFAAVTFAAPTTYTLTAGSTYYVVLRETSGLGFVNWSYGTSITPTGEPGVSAIKRLIGTTDLSPTTWTTNSSVNNWFDVNVSPVPEPSTVAFLLVGSVAMLAGVRRRA